MTNNSEQSPRLTICISGISSPEQIGKTIGTVLRNLLNSEERIILLVAMQKELFNDVQPTEEQ